MGSADTSNILMIAFHYPPYGSSSGLRRTHCFSRFLPEHDWQPFILTADPRAYDTVKTENARPAIEGEGAAVTRAFALDSLRHLGFRGKYPGFLALPDRWVSWFPAAVIKGLAIIRKQDVRVIWSTYPIATAHLIGLCLSRFSGVPWVADFRDPMIDEVHPSGSMKRKVFRYIEKKTLTHAAGACFTTPGALKLYQDRYPELDSSRWICIENGYDEGDFASVVALASDQVAAEGHPAPPIRLVHSGTLYPLERDPSCFFSALAQLKATGEISRGDLRIILRATGHDDFINNALKHHQIEDIVSVEQDLDYSQALQEMCAADGLLLFQAANCNQQIPAKLYEYMRSARPLLALTDPGGDTAELIERENAGIVADLHSEHSVLQGLRRLMGVIHANEFKPVSQERVRHYSRQKQAGKLADFLNQIVSTQ